MTRKNLCVAKNYKDKDGNEKTQWLNVGSLFVKDDGKMSIVLDTIPTGVWDGRIQVFDVKDKGIDLQQKEDSNTPF